MNEQTKEKGTEEKCLGLIKARSSSFALSTGVPADELFSEGLVIYAECLLKYDKSMGTSFTTFLYRVLTTRFINFVEEYRNQLPAIFWFDETLPEIPVLDNIVNGIQFQQRIAQLSPEARGVVALLDNCANEILSYQPMRNKYPIKKPHAQKNLIGALKKYLKNLGWGPATIENTFNELRLAVNTF